MNKDGFMSQLKGLLADIPEAEREEALQYYDDYFEDAGAENEQSVISSLGSPKNIAENIKAELRGEVIPASASAGDHAITKYGQIIPAQGETEDRTGSTGGAGDLGGTGGHGSFDGTGGHGGSGGHGSFDGTGGHGGSGGHGGFGATGSAGSFGGKGGFGSAGSSGGAGGYAGGGNFGGAGASGGTAVLAKGGRPAWLWILIVLGLICIVPGIFGIGTGIFGVIVGIVGTWFSLIVAFGATSFSFFAVSIVLAGVAFWCLPSSAVVFLLLLGAGMLFACLALVILSLTTWMCGVATPAIFKGVGFICKKCIQGVKKAFDHI